MVFSFQRSWGIALLLFISLASFLIASQLGLWLLVFFTVIGAIDLLTAWRQFAERPMTPMRPQTVAISLIWYLGTIAIFLAMIFAMANTGLPGTELATVVLSS